MDAHIEADLLQRARHYDRDALAEIYDRFSPGIYQYARRLLGEDSPAEECMLETFSRFLSALNAGKGPDDCLQAYLYRIAHNWITDRYRRMPVPPVPLDEDQVVAPGAGTEAQVESALLRQEVRAALRCLTPAQRQVIVLKYVEGCDNETIAVALGKPLGAVKSLQHRALNTLKRILVRDEEVDYGGFARTV
jgi:RNA polymerase sigma-70 factor (ECF subfamily)